MFRTHFNPTQWKVNLFLHVWKLSSLTNISKNNQNIWPKGREENVDEHKKLNICSTLLAGVQSKYTNMATAPSSGEAGKEHKDSVKIQNREKERKRKKERKNRKSKRKNVALIIIVYSVHSVMNKKRVSLFIDITSKKLQTAPLKLIHLIILWKINFNQIKNV